MSSSTTHAEKHTSDPRCLISDGRPRHPARRRDHLPLHPGDPSAKVLLQIAPGLSGRAQERMFDRGLKERHSTFRSFEVDHAPDVELRDAESDVMRFTRGQVTSGASGSCSAWRSGWLSRGG